MTKSRDGVKLAPLDLYQVIYYDSLARNSLSSFNEKTGKSLHQKLAKMFDLPRTKIYSMEKNVPAKNSAFKVAKVASRLKLNKLRINGPSSLEK